MKEVLCGMSAVEGSVSAEGGMSAVEGSVSAEGGMSTVEGGVSAELHRRQWVCPQEVVCPEPHRRPWVCPQEVVCTQKKAVGPQNFTYNQFFFPLKKEEMRPGC